MEWIVKAQKTSNIVDIGDEKIEVFKNKEDQTGGDYAEDQVKFFLFPFWTIDVNGSEVVDQDGDGQDQDVNRHEGHVKDATGSQQ